MAQKRNLDFESIYGTFSVDDDDMLIGNEDRITKNIDDNDQVKLMDEKKLKEDIDLEINGNGYHITF